MATISSDDGHLLLCKLDLKDGYWRMLVLADEEENFAYVLPTSDQSNESMIVIPSALQMGWKPYFCAASKTARRHQVGTINTSAGAPHATKRDKDMVRTPSNMEQTTSRELRRTCRQRV
jgi:hypothetical protein